MHSGKRLRQGFLCSELLLVLIHTNSTMHKFREKSGEINSVHRHEHKLALHVVKELCVE